MKKSNISLTASKAGRCYFFSGTLFVLIRMSFRGMEKKNNVLVNSEEDEKLVELKV